MKGRGGRNSGPRRGGRGGPRGERRPPLEDPKIGEGKLTDLDQTDDNEPVIDAVQSIDDMDFEELVGEGEKTVSIIQGLYTNSFGKPSKIQCQAIPVLMDGKSLVAQAEVGVGKTLAFLIPLALKIDQQNHNIQAVVVTPTIDLAKQIAEQEFKAVNEHMNYQYDLVAKDLPAPRDGTQIVFGTAASINALKERLDQVKFVVFDEADEILRQGSSHNNGARGIIRYVKGKNPDAQLAFFSATYPPDIRHYIIRLEHDINQISIARTEQVKGINHFITRCERGEINDLLLSIFKGSTIASSFVFCNTKAKCREVADFLNSHGLLATAITGDNSFDEREQIIEDFRKGEKIKILVATNAYSRGINITDATHVFNIDLPQNIKHQYRGRNRYYVDVDSYVHRSGRAGRFGKRGFCLSFITGERDFRTMMTIVRNIAITCSEIPRSEFTDKVEIKQDAGEVITEETVEANQLTTQMAAEEDDVPAPAPE